MILTSLLPSIVCLESCFSVVVISATDPLVAVAAMGVPVIVAAIVVVAFLAIMFPNSNRIRALRSSRLVVTSVVVAMAALVSILDPCGNVSACCCVIGDDGGRRCPDNGLGNGGGRRCPGNGIVHRRRGDVCACVNWGSVFCGAAPLRGRTRLQRDHGRCCNGALLLPLRFHHSL